MCVGEEFISPQALCPQREEQASLVYERLVFAVWTLLVCPRGFSRLGLWYPQGLPRRWGPKGLRRADLLPSLLAATKPGSRGGCAWGAHCGQPGKSQIATHSQDWVTHPEGTKPPHCPGRFALGTTRSLTWAWASAVQAHFPLLSVIKGSQLDSDQYIFLGIVTDIL